MPALRGSAGILACGFTDLPSSVLPTGLFKRALRPIPFLQSVCFAIVVRFFTSPGFAQSGASYTALRRIDTITVDGNLNEASWATATNTSVFTLWNGNVAPVSLQTSAKLDHVTGQFSFTNALDPGSPQLFYRLQAP